MATSGIDDNNLTRDQIIRAAFETIGVAIANEPLEAEDVAVGAVALNALSNAWKAHGMQLWKRGRYSLTSATTPALTASTYSYDFATAAATSFTLKPMRIVEVSRKLTSDSTETSMTRLSLEEYEALPNKTTTGTPLQYYYEPKNSSGTIYFWPAPDATFAANNSIEIIYQAAMQDMDVGNEDVDYPNEWYRALILNLANDLAPKYGIGIQERELLKIEADGALELAMSYDVEDTSVFFQPDYKGMQ